MNSQQLDVLLIGGSGFVSGTLARTAAEAGHKVWAVTRGRLPLPAAVTGIEADRHVHREFESAIRTEERHWDLVVDCIGYRVEDAVQDISVFRERARHLVFISTDFVFAPSARRFPRNLEAPVYEVNGYGGDKRLCELEFVNGDTGEMVWTLVRPGHIYGPGSLLGCLPAHSRDTDLIPRLKRREPLQLVGGGRFLLQPIFAPDLAQLILSFAGNRRTWGQIYEAAGPDIIEACEYYRIIADILGVELMVKELLVGGYWDEHPESRSFLCHRFYDLERLKEHALHVPATPIEEGLHRHVNSLLSRE